MGKASRTKRSGDRREYIAAQRQAQRRADQRKRIYLAGGSILVVAIVVIALVLVKLNSGGTAPAASNGPTGAALAAVTKQVTDVPASVSDKIADGGVEKAMFVSAPNSADLQSLSNSQGSYFATVSGTPLASGGKPEVLYLGAEYCPFCAAQRWAMINALSRFGTFTGLTATHSSSTDTDPNTPTFTFYGSKYASKYITFTPVEESTNYRVGNSTDTSVPYQTLQTPSSAQTALGKAYDPGSYIPFIDFGSKYAQVGNLAPLAPTLLDGKSWTAIAADMNNPSSSLGQAIIGNANYETAAICKLTGNQPATACTPIIQKLQADLAK